MPSDAFVVDRGTLGRWYVLDVAKKLDARRELAGARSFDDLQNGAIGDADTLTVAEALETRRVNSRLSCEQAKRIVDAWHRLELGTVLGDAGDRLEDCSPERLDEIAAAVTTLEGPWIRTAKVTKVLALKRPGLVPMLDGLVQWMVPGRDLREKLAWFHRAACTWPRVTRSRGTTVVQSIEKLLWFDTLFPWVGGEANGTATHLVSLGWRLVHWPACGRRGSATGRGGPQRDGCVVHVPGAPPDVASAREELRRTDAELARRIGETVRRLDAAADAGDIAPRAPRRS